MSERYSRRSFLKVAGGAAAAATAGGVALNETTRVASAASGWSTVTSPTSKTLYGVSETVAGPFAVGKAGLVLSGKGGSWEIVVDDGPATRGNALRAVEPTDDKKRIWFAGSSGAVGAYDVDRGIKYNYSAPKGKTSTWEAIAITGKRENETIYLANGSGEVLKGTTDSKGCVQWGSVVKPGSGSNMAAIDFVESQDSMGHAVDTSSNAFATEDAGGTWKDVGIPNSQVNLFDVISYIGPDGNEQIYVAGGAGKLYRLDCTCGVWTPYDLGSHDNRGIDHMNGDKLVSGTSGNIWEKPSGDDWQQLDSPVGADLYEASYGSNSPDVIVGGSGTILTR